MNIEQLDFRDPITRYLADNAFCVPLGQVVTLIFLISICLLVQKHKLGLLVSYTFVFYWGFIFNRDFFINSLGEVSVGLYLYCFLGIFMVIMSMIGFFNEKAISHVGVCRRKDEPRKLFIKVPEAG